MSKFFTIEPTKQGKLTQKDYSDQALKWVFTDKIRGKKTTVSKRQIGKLFKKALAPEVVKGEWSWNTDTDEARFTYINTFVNIQNLPFERLQKYLGKQGYTCGQRYWKLLTQDIYWDYENKASSLRFDLTVEEIDGILEQDPRIQAYIRRVEKRAEPKPKPKSELKLPDEVLVLREEVRQLPAQLKLLQAKVEQAYAPTPTPTLAPLTPPPTPPPTHSCTHSLTH